MVAQAEPNTIKQIHKKPEPYKQTGDLQNYNMLSNYEKYHMLPRRKFYWVKVKYKKKNKKGPSVNPHP